ncbi:MAG: polysaccharide deacetylase family protein [Gemmatimonadota bacterium]
MTGPYLTISVDDGHPTDLRTAELLARFGLRATFYIPANNPERELLSDGDIRELAASFDIGGHTLNHRTLRGLATPEAWKEIDDGRKWMEDVVGRTAGAFCYPRGKFDGSTVELVRRSGYRGARTCLFNRNRLSKKPYAWGVSTHAYSHPAHIQFRHALLEGNISGAIDFVRIHGMRSDWEEHFLKAVEWTARTGGVAHLYLHSWEIDANEDWAKLERVLRRVADRTEFTRLTNSELFDLTVTPPHASRIGDA